MGFLSSRGVPVEVEVRVVDYVQMAVGVRALRRRVEGRPRHTRLFNRVEARAIALVAAGSASDDVHNRWG